MALEIAASSTDNINFGTLGSNDFDPVTVLFWDYITTITNNEFFSFKDPSSRFRIMARDTNRMRIQVRGSTFRTYDSTDNFLTTNEWQFFCVCQDSVEPAGAKIRMYRGTLTDTAVEASYATTTDGASLEVPTGDFHVGTPFTGENGHRPAIVCVIPKLLPLVEIRWLQKRMLSAMAHNPLLFCQLGFNGVNTQLDWSGSGNHGTVTGCTVAEHVPIQLGGRLDRLAVKAPVVATRARHLPVLGVA